MPGDIPQTFYYSHTVHRPMMLLFITSHPMKSRWAREKPILLENAVSVDFHWNGWGILDGYGAVRQVSTGAIERLYIHKTHWCTSEYSRHFVLQKFTSTSLGTYRLGLELIFTEFYDTLALDVSPRDTHTGAVPSPESLYSIPLPVTRLLKTAILRLSRASIWIQQNC
jgi:hypothetical protein